MVLRLTVANFEYFILYFWPMESTTVQRKESVAIFTINVDFEENTKRLASRFSFFYSIQAQVKRRVQKLLKNYFRSTQLLENHIPHSNLKRRKVVCSNLKIRQFIQYLF